MYIWAYKTYFYLLTNFTIHPISCYFIKGRFGFAHISFISWQTLHLLSFPSNKGGLENCKRGYPEHFCLIRGKMMDFFMLTWVSWGCSNHSRWGLYPLCLPSFFLIYSPFICCHQLFHIHNFSFFIYLDFFH